MAILSISILTFLVGMILACAWRGHNQARRRREALELNAWWSKREWEKASGIDRD